MLVLAEATARAGRAHKFFSSLDPRSQGVKKTLYVSLTEQGKYTRVCYGFQPLILLKLGGPMMLSLSRDLVMSRMGWWRENSLRSSREIQVPIPLKIQGRMSRASLVARW